VEIEGLVVDVLQVVVRSEKLTKLSLHRTLGLLLINQIDCHLSNVLDFKYEIILSQKHFIGLIGLVGYEILFLGFRTYQELNPSYTK